VISDVFTDMFFLFLQEPAADMKPGEGLWQRVDIAVSGEEPFQLHCYFADSTAQLMAENYLGLNSEELNMEMVQDIIKEAVNVITGNLLNQMNNDSVLGIPQYWGAVDKLDSIEKENFIDYLVEEELLRVVLSDPE